MSIHDINHVIASVRGEEAAQLFRELITAGEDERNVSDVVVFRMSRTSLEDAQLAAQEVEENFPGSVRALGEESQLTPKTAPALRARFKP